MNRKSVFLLAIISIVGINILLFTREITKYNYKQYSFTERSKNSFKKYLLSEYFRQCQDGYTVKFKDYESDDILQFKSFHITVGDTYGSNRKGVIQLDSITNKTKTWWRDQPLLLEYTIDSTGKEVVKSFFDQSFQMTETLVFYKSNEFNCQN